MNYFLIRLPNKQIPIAIHNSKLFGDSSVMTNAEQQQLITAQECDGDWNVERLTVTRYHELTR